MIEEFGTEVETKGGQPYGNQTDSASYAKPITGRNKMESDKKEKKESNNPSQWACYPENEFAAVGRTTKILPNGLYTVDSDNRGIVFKKKEINVDDLIHFPNSLGDRILQEIDQFWTVAAPKFKAHGFLHRRGYLFYGPQGSGKTCILQQVIADIINRGGLVFLGTCNPEFLSMALNHFRNLEFKRPIITLFEDIDAIINNFGESSVLAFLDGEMQIDKCINIATTNFPELLPKRLVNRPRRFDRIIKIGFPSAEMRKIYFQKKLGIEDPVKWVAASQDYSFAACAELVISVECFGNSFDETKKRLDEMMKATPSSSEFDGKLVGFNSMNGSDSKTGRNGGF